jgi:hypothetical protein
MLVPRDRPIMQILSNIGQWASKQSREGTCMAFFYFRVFQRPDA